MRPTVAGFYITNATTGVVLGFFPGDTPFAATEAMIRETGFNDFDPGTLMSGYTFVRAQESLDPSQRETFVP